MIKALSKIEPHIRLLLGILLVEVVIFSALEPETFPTIINVQSMSLQAAEFGLLALGIVLTMIVAGIDLSIVATGNVAGILAAKTMTSLVDTSTTVAIVCGVAVAILWGMSAGLFNGAIVVGLRVSPILATLGTLTLFTGIGTVITSGSAVFGVDGFTWVGTGSLLGVPVPFVLLVGLAVLLTALLTKTIFGDAAYLSGLNARAATFSGLPVRRVTVSMYVLSGVTSAIAGLVILGRTNTAQIDFGSSYVLLAVLVAVLGGLDPYGGSGGPLGAVLATVVLQVMSTGLNQVLLHYNGSNFFKNFAWGILLIGVLAISQRRSEASSSGT